MTAEPAGDVRVLPPEIWTEILSRVPVKSILRCRSVCKSWYSLISCPNFISDYSVRNLHKSGNRLLLQPYDPHRDLRPFSSHDGSFMDSREHDDVPEDFLGSHVRIVGSCNGLVCLSKYDHSDLKTLTFLVWNPTIRKVVELPSRSFPRRVGDFCYNGFGFDFKTGDYKVMCMHYVYSDGNNVCSIYDMRKGVWRDISPPMHPRNARGPTPSECYLDGAVHWTGFIRKFGSSDRTLLSFDMIDETFQETRMPECSEFVWNVDDRDDTLIGSRSVAFSGLIHVIVWKMKQNDYIAECSVWAMKEYGVAESWTKLFNINPLSAGIDRGIDPNEFRLLEDGEVLMTHAIFLDEYDGENFVDMYKQDLLSYNVESRKCKKLFSCSRLIEDMCFFEESLVLM